MTDGLALREGRAKIVPVAADTSEAGSDRRRRRRGIVEWLVLLGAIAGAGSLFVMGKRTLGLGVLLLMVLWAVRDLLLRWTTGVAVLVFVLLLVPSRIYKLPTPLPFDLDPYRLVLLGMLAVWLLARATRRGPGIRRTHIDAATALFLLAIGLSYVANLGEYAGAQSFVDMVKFSAYIASFPLTLYLVSSVVPSRGEALKLVDVLVAIGTFQGLMAVAERMTGYNPFYHLESWIPGLVHVQLPGAMLRGGVRVAGSTAHPVALATVLAMLLMLSLAEAFAAQSHSRRAFFVTCAVVIAGGAFLTISRTALVAMAAGFGVLLVGFPRQRLVLVSGVAALVGVIHLVFGGVVGSLVFMFRPSTLVAQEVGNQNGRLEDYAWSLPRILGRPLFGLGYGSLDPERGARMLDNQYLGLLLETGVTGFLAFVYVIWRAVSVPFRARRGAEPRHSAVLIGFAAASAAFAAASATFDTIAFPQVPYLFFVLAGLCTVLMRAGNGSAAAED